jgi:DNA-binding NarL/FixJ family response regulator
LRMDSGNGTHPMKYNRATILIIENNPDHWVPIQSAVAQRFPEVEAVWVSTAKQAEQYLCQCLDDDGRLPSLILLDLNLPDRSQGVLLLSALKAVGSHFLHVPVLVLSAPSESPEVAAIYLCGANACLVKPRDPDHWLLLVESLRKYWWNTVTLPGDRN